MFNKIFGQKGQEVVSAAINAVKKEEPVYRFNTGGFQRMGAQTRSQDTRTPAQIDATIDAFAEKIPAVAEFREQIKSLNPRHRALIADTLELANTYEFLMTPIRMVEKRAYDGKSMLDVLLPKFIRASKENPQVLKFTQTVIDNTDTQTSKYFLANAAGFNPQAILNRDEAINNIVMREAGSRNFRTNEELHQFISTMTSDLEKKYPIMYSEKTIVDNPEMGEMIGASADMVKPVAEQTINGMYLGTFEKQHKFLDAMSIFLNPEIRPENIKFLRRICDVLDSFKTKKDVPVDFFPFLRTNVPKAQAELNLAQLPQAVKDAENAGKEINATDFIMSNVNFVKPQPKIDLSKGIKYAPTELQK